jgi:hypothetical protein
MIRPMPNDVKNSTAEKNASDTYPTKKVRKKGPDSKMKHERNTYAVTATELQTHAIAKQKYETKKNDSTFVHISLRSKREREAAECPTRTHVELGSQLDEFTRCFPCVIWEHPVARIRDLMVPKKCSIHFNTSQISRKNASL